MRGEELRGEEKKKACASSVNVCSVRFVVSVALRGM